MLLLIAAAQLAAAGWAASFPGVVRFAPVAAPQVYVDDPWSDGTRKRMYMLRDMPSRLDGIVGEIFHDSPLPAAPLWYAIVDRFPQAESRRIADGCKLKYAQPWDRIGCASYAVFDYFKGRKFRGPRTFCMYHAQTFQQTFMALDIPGSWASKVDASGDTIKNGHVANAIILRANDGKTYSYVIDSGWFPGRLFPLNEAAAAYHDRNGDGFTDFRDPPLIGQPPAESYRAAR